MSQIPLSPKTSETSIGEAVLVVDDARGRIVYTPGFVPDDVAHAWFTELRLGAPWKAERRFMYDREVDVPRLQAHFRLAPPTADSLRRVMSRLARRVRFRDEGARRIALDTS